MLLLNVFQIHQLYINNSCLNCTAKCNKQRCQQDGELMDVYLSFMQHGGFRKIGVESQKTLGSKVIHG